MNLTRFNQQLFVNKHIIVLVQILFLITIVILSLNSSSQVAVSATNHEQAKRVPKVLDYDVFVQKYRKFSQQTVLSTLNRAKLFFARTLEIFKHNTLYATKQVRHFLQQNQFLDLTSDEIKQHFVASHDSGLNSIVHADQWPDYPADMLHQQHVQQQNRSDAIHDEFSQSALSNNIQYPYNYQANHHQQSHAGVVNFLQSADEQLNAASAKQVLDHMRTNPQLAETIIKLTSATHNKKLVAHETRSADEARRHNQITKTPFVRPNNKYYDPTLIPSESILGALSDYAYNNNNNNDDALDEQGNSKSWSMFSAFKNLVEDYSNYFKYANELIYSDDDDDENDEDEDEFFDASDTFYDDTVFDVDWRRTGCVSRTKAQLNCNSCYAFAALDLMEFFYCRQMKTSTEFSVQYVVDCGHKTQLNACRGGKLSNVGRFIQQHGIQLNAAYPYRGQAHECPFDAQSDAEHKSYSLKPNIKAWRLFHEIHDWYKWLAKSPLIVGISMPTDFLAYGGGIHSGIDCVPGMVHAMLLVGSGKQDGETFWLLKNSFSDSWGEAGYFRLSKHAPIKCFNSALVARVGFSESIR